MISEILFNNYRLFKDENELSFVADGRTKKLLSNSVDLDGRNVLKAVAIYGPNNSGKSHIFHLMEVLKCVLTGRGNCEFNREIFADAPLSTFSITYNNNDKKGWVRYEFAFDSKTKRFVKEKLVTITYYPAGTPFEKTVFEKDDEKKVFQVFAEDDSAILSFIPSKSPILHSIELSNGKFAPLSEWLLSLQTLGNSIELLRMYDIPINKTIAALKGSDAKRKRFITAFVKDADLSIDDFGYQKDIHLIKNGETIDESVLSNYELDALHLTTTYGNKEVPSLFVDSSGTKKMEALASYVYEAISEGKTLVVDELDNGLHFRLTRAIVSAFNNLANEKGQLLFTAHDLMLIDCRMLLRKDQIYFLERNDGKASLYCLKNATAASGGPREGTDILKRYNKGDYGKLPSPNFIDDLLALLDKG
jgi:hypothetical protein